MESHSYPADEKQKEKLEKPISAAHLLHNACCSEDKRVCNAAYQRLGEYLLRMALSRLRTQPHLAYLAEEVTQQALMTIWQKLKDGRGPDNPAWFMSWCGGIVIHKLLDEQRKLGRSPLELLGSPGDDDLTPHLELPDVDAVAPEEYALENETQSELVSLIQEHPRLNPDIKVVLLHGYLLDRNDSELAEQLRLEAVTIRVLRFRGLRTLRGDPEFMKKVERLAFPQHILHPQTEEHQNVKRRTHNKRVPTSSEAQLR